MGFKFIGCIFILSSSILYAYSHVFSLKQRVEFLNALILFIKHLKINILTTRYSLQDILERFKEINSNKFIDVITLLLKNDKNKDKKIPFLKETDIKMVVNLFNIITCSSTIEIEAILDDYIRQIVEIYDIAKQEWLKNSKLITTLGVMSGIAINIILF